MFEVKHIHGRSHLQDLEDLQSTLRRGGSRSPITLVSDAAVAVRPMMDAMGAEPWLMKPFGRSPQKDGGSQKKQWAKCIVLAFW